MTHRRSGLWAHVQVDVSLVSHRITIAIVANDQQGPETAEQMVLLDRAEGSSQLEIKTRIGVSIPSRELWRIIRLKRGVGADVLVSSGVNQHVICNTILAS